MNARNRRVMLGVSGAIAAYKAADVLRGLRREGVDVTVAMTANACHFVTPFLLGNLAGRPAIVDQFAPEQASVRHIPEAEETDLLLLAPATADIMAKLSAGIADDFLTTFYLACPAPVLLAPAMNWRMWEHPATRANTERLRERGVGFVGPVEGELATFHRGIGRMADPGDVVVAALRHMGGSLLEGRRVLVTAGPTQEPLDSMRVFTNRSSGRMGYALAREAWLRGAAVDLVSGPTSLPAPDGPELVSVTSADEMRQAVMERADAVDVIIMCAAVSDFRPRQRAESKLSKQGLDVLEVELVRTPDILRELGGMGPQRPLLVGFAAEDTDIEGRARGKLEAKACDLIVANDISRPDVGAGVEHNEVVLIERGREPRRLEKAPKHAIAVPIMDRVGELLEGR